MEEDWAADLEADLEEAMVAGLAADLVEVMEVDYLELKDRISQDKINE